MDAVATIGPHVHPAALGAVPSNVRVERFVPQADLLGQASAVASHGGAGAVVGRAMRTLRNTCFRAVRLEPPSPLRPTIPMKPFNRLVVFYQDAEAGPALDALIKDLEAEPHPR